MKACENTDLGRIKVKKQPHKQLEEEAKRIETTPDILIYNAPLQMPTKLMRGNSAQPTRAVSTLLKGMP